MTSDEEHLTKRRQPLAGLHPNLRVAIAGIGVLIGLAMILLGIRSFGSEEPPPGSVTVPTAPGG